MRAASNRLVVSDIKNSRCLLPWFVQSYEFFKYEGLLTLYNLSKVGTEEFDFGIERFCKRIGRTVIVESTDRKATERKLHETQVEKL